MLLQMYAGQKIGLRELRKSMGVGMLKCASTRNQVFDSLDLIHDRAMGKVAAALVDYIQEVPCIGR